MKSRNFIFIFLISLFTISAYAAHSSKPIICTQEYALCTSAPCIPDPRHPDYALCSCIVESGDSAGFKTCDKRAPSQGQFKVKQLISTFSFKQFKTRKSMDCARGKPWSDCLDAPCTVSPQDPAKAICSCKINHDQAFFTFGGACDEATCATGFWSGATINTSKALRKSLFEKLHITQNPWTNIQCPGADKK